ncbi:MAG: hypothetical protein WDN46_12485 [Methylocella sp.]
MDDSNQTSKAVAGKTVATIAPPPPQTPNSQTVKSARSNGNRAFAVGGDGRTAWARRQRDVTELHISDIGGAEGASEAMLSLCRRAATIEVTLEQLEASMSEGKDVDYDLYNRLSGNLRRILESIGLQRVAKDVTPDLKAYIASKYPTRA